MIINGLIFLNLLKMIGSNYAYGRERDEKCIIKLYHSLISNY